MTKREVLNYIKETYKEDATIQEYVKHEIELLDNKVKSNEKRKERRAEEQAEMENQILEILREVNVATATEIADEIGVKFQKVSPRLKALILRGEVEKSTKGKNTYFNVKETATEEVEVAETETETEEV